MSKDKYKEEVIDPGDQASQLAKEICFQSHENCSAVKIIPHEPGNFRGPVGFTWNTNILLEMMKNGCSSSGNYHWAMLEEVENDGAGGKPQFFTLVGDPEVFRGLGWEIISMTADDFARTGRMPCVIDNEINVKRITKGNFHLFKAMMQGYGDALARSNLVNITGEVAVMKHSITAFCDTGANEQLILTWGASVIGLCHKSLLLTKLDCTTNQFRIKPGMPIVGFWEPGYRCNGGTFFTNLMLKVFGPKIEDIMLNQKAMEFARKLTVPSQSYAKTICRVLGWQPDGTVGKPLVDIAGIAHITGGGVWGKFGEILPKGIGAILDNMPKPAPVLLEAQELSWKTDLRLTDLQAYSTLHGGCGMLVICANNNQAEDLKVEAIRDGIQSSIVGETMASDDNEIIINSQFREARNLSSKELS